MKGWNLEAIQKLKDKKPAPIKTNALTQAALRILKMKGYNVWRCNNGAVWDAKFKGYRANSATPGISDIIGYDKNSRFCAFEIKAGKDKLSPAQIQFLKGVNDAGGLGIVVKCIEDLENV